MKNYRTLFYHALWGDGKWIDNAIQLSTQAIHLWRIGDWDILKQGFSHQEIWTPPEYANEVGFEYKLIDNHYAGNCWTSTMGQVGGKNRTGNGTCVRPASEVLKHPERWSYIEHEVTDGKYECMVNWMHSQVIANEGYGLGKTKNVCSEFSHNANIVSGEVEGPFRFIDPLHSAILLTRSGKEIRRLG